MPSIESSAQSAVQTATSGPAIAASQGSEGNVGLQPSGRPETPTDRASTFRAVSGEAETVPGGPLLVAAYAVIWVVLFIVIARVFLRQTEAARNLASLEAAIANKAKERP
ncbi:MAG: hypothetical protein NVS3B20_25480 [Polyangiales bacterium]